LTLPVVSGLAAKASRFSVRAAAALAIGPSLSKRCSIIEHVYDVRTKSTSPFDGRQGDEGSLEVGPPMAVATFSVARDQSQHVPNQLSNQSPNRETKTLLNEHDRHALGAHFHKIASTMLIRQVELDAL
jgi:hypothetical protein